MPKDEILERAKALIGNKEKGHKQLAGNKETVAQAKGTLEEKESLDVYIIFDTTGSMDTYINSVRQNIGDVTTALLNGVANIRISINGVGDHCDGDKMIQMRPLTRDALTARRSIESIIMTSGGDAPEAYECMALAMAQRIPQESLGRKRAVVLVGDSIPHGIIDSPCKCHVDYRRAFEALKIAADAFYLVGCSPSEYDLQRSLVDPKKKEHEQFIELGSMVEALPALLVAIAKKVESQKALNEYLQRMDEKQPALSGKVRGMLPG